MTEAAVGVAERGDRVADGSSLPVEEEPLEPPTIEDAGVPGEEPGSRVEVGSRHRQVVYPSSSSSRSRAVIRLRTRSGGSGSSTANCNAPFVTP